MKKYLGWACWLVAFLVPFNPALLGSEEASNTIGVISFVVFIALLFTGYWLYDSSAPAPSQGEHH
jgi:hypothetical protein